MSVEITITAKQFDALSNAFQDALDRNVPLEDVGLAGVPLSWNAKDFSRFFVGVFSNEVVAAEFKLRWG